MLNYLSGSSQAKAKARLHDICQTETKQEAQNAFELFVRMYEDKYRGATQCLEKDREELMTFYDFPAMH